MVVNIETSQKTSCGTCLCTGWLVIAGRLTSANPTLRGETVLTVRACEIKARRMAYIDEGEGAPIVFAHGNPTSSYLWRNVMPACRGLGRLIACDMIGMGDSEKLLDSGPDRYTYAENRSFLFALWEKLGIDKDVVFVVHDAGAL